MINLFLCSECMYRNSGANMLWHDLMMSGIKPGWCKLRHASRDMTSAHTHSTLIGQVLAGSEAYQWQHATWPSFCRHYSAREGRFAVLKVCQEEVLRFTTVLTWIKSCRWKEPKFKGRWSLKTHLMKVHNLDMLPSCSVYTVPYVRE